MDPFSPARRRKVLIVDDNPGFLQLLSAIMRTAGYEIDTAKTGMEGIRKFRQDAADVIVTDRSMPQMDGEQMTEVIKTINPDVPVILITGLPDGVRHAALFEALLVKPFHMEDLLPIVENIFRRREMLIHAG